MWRGEIVDITSSYIIDFGVVVVVARNAILNTIAYRLKT